MKPRVNLSAGNVASVFFSVLSLTACNPEVVTPTGTKPILLKVTAVPDYVVDTTPNYTFNSTAAGTIIYGGLCSSATTSAVKGNNTITFNTLALGTYSNCTIKVKDASNNSSSALAVNTFNVVSVTQKPLNDTGAAACGDYAYGYSNTSHNNNVNCVTAGATKTTAGTDGNGDPVPAGQDAVYGRDSDPSSNSNSDGHKGFSFTKLKADGTALAIQNGTWSDAGSEAAGTKWSCVQDNVTGLIWEVKTNDNGLRDQDWFYSWYNSTGINDGGHGGYSDYMDVCFTTTRCDTEKYIADVNATALCGASDWRLPTAHELLSIVTNDRVNPAIDTAFFPNTGNSSHWSSSPSPELGAEAFGVGFDTGKVVSFNKYTTHRVRLVRGSQ